MKKTFLFLTLLTILVALVFAASLILTSINVLSKCIHITQNPERVVLVGHVKNLTKDEKWFKVNFNLCDSSFPTIANVQIFVPRLAPWIYAGQSLPPETNYTWSRLPIDKVDSVLDGNNLLAIPIENLNSIDELKGGVINGQKIVVEQDANWDCGTDPQCSQRLDYFAKYGEIQKSFISVLKRRDVLRLIIDFLTGRAVVLSNIFGKVNSEENAKTIIENGNF